MSNYANLIAGITAVIKTNGQNAITGQLLQNELLSIVYTLGYGYQYMGIANPLTNPGTPDAKVFYIAYEPGTYSNFDGISVTGLCVLKYVSSWVKEDIPVSGGGSDFAVETTDLTLMSGDPNKLKFADRLRESNITTGKNYIILRESLTLAGQMSVQNAIYEIRYDFELNSALSVPANCILFFNGGSISGTGTLTFDGTKIIGNAKITCGIAGTISDEIVNVGWFGLKSDDATFDNGAIINKVCSVFKSVVIPTGNYYFTTPIVMGTMVFVQSFGALYWRGTNTNVAAITISESNAVYVRFLGLISGDDNETIDFAGDGGTTVRGLEIKNCNNSNFYFRDILNFNEGLRLFGDAAGCSYNAFYLGKIRNTNRGIRIYQDNGGWCNENKFYNGRIYNESGFISASRNRYAVYIKGPGTETDTYNGANALTFYGISMEGFNQTCAIYAYSVQYSDFSRIRAEGVATFVKFEGGPVGNIVAWSYPGTKAFDAQAARSFPLRRDVLPWFLLQEINLLDFSQCYDAGVPETHWLAPKGVQTINCRATTLTLFNYSATMTVSGGVVTTGNHLPCLIVDVTDTRMFYVKTDGSVRVVVYYLEKTDGTVINPGPTQENYISPAGNTSAFSYGSAVYGFQTGSNVAEHSIYVRDPNVKKIGIAVKGTLTKCQIYSIKYTAMVFLPAKINDYGTTAQRPTYKIPGQEYFDTDLGKMIVWNGTDWVNVDGSALV